MSSVDYCECRPIIIKAIVQVHRSIGGDLDEMCGYAGELFLKAVRTFREGAGRNIKSWCYKVAWDDTFAARRIEIGRKKRYEYMEDLSIVCGRPNRVWTEILEDLSEDARMLAYIAVEAPEAIKVTADGIPKKNSLFAYVRKAFNWSEEQLTAASEEIRFALNGG